MVQQQQQYQHGKKVGRQQYYGSCSSNTNTTTTTTTTIIHDGNTTIDNTSITTIQQQPTGSIIWKENNRIYNPRNDNSSDNSNEYEQLLPSYNKGIVGNYSKYNSSIDDDNNSKTTTTSSSNRNNNNKNEIRRLLHVVIVVIVTTALLLAVRSSSSSTTTRNSSNSNNNNNTPLTTTTSFYPVMSSTFIRSSSSSGSSSTKEDDNDDSKNSNSYKIPWKQIDRATYDDPITNFMDPTLFHNSLLRNFDTTETGGGGGDGPKSIFRFPYPTGSFWTNLVLPATAEDNSLSYPIVVYPYAYKWSTKQVIVSYPNLHRIINTKSIHDYYIPDLVFGILESIDIYKEYLQSTIQSIDPPNPNIPSSITNRKIIAFDPLSITLRYYCSTTSSSSRSSSSSSSSSTSTKKERNEKEEIDDATTSSYWDVYLVTGSPYVTMKYTNAIPYIKAYTTFTNVLCPPTTTSNECSIISDETSNTNTSENTIGNDESSSKIHETITLRGTQFIIETREGTRWIMITSNSVTIQMNMNLRSIISISSTTSGDVYSGVIRYAIIPPSSSSLSDDDKGNDESKVLPLDQTQDTTTNTATAALYHIMNTTGVQRLIHHASVYPISSTVDWKFRTATVGTTTNTATSTLSSTHNTTISSIVSSIFHYIFGSKDSSTTTMDPMNQENTNTISSTTSSQSSSGRVGTIEFQFQTESFHSNKETSSSELLMLALPHHMDGLQIKEKQKLDHSTFSLVYQCIKGPMYPVIGTSWFINVPLLSLGFDGDSGSNHDNIYLSSPVVRTQILQSLQEDVKLYNPSSITEDIYGFGKQAARLAQLVHISHLYMIGDNSTTDSGASTVHEEGATMLRESLVGVLTSKVSDSLVYDANFGGMVTTNGLTDSHADFGNGRYNDHHFHYGYFLYACAIMGKVDPTFVEEFGDYIDSIFYDIANYDHFESKESTGPFFPGARHKIWYDGHSYASGMFPFGNGKSQESSSEAINGYYGAYLWSVVRHGAANDPSSDISLQTDFARLLLATEIQGAKQYWHMMPPSKSTKTTSPAPVYPPDFAANYMVGNIGMLDALCSTWFGNEELYVHMINLIPVTSATGELFRSQYIEQEYNNILKPLGEVEMAWRGYVVSDHAITAPNAAWNEAQLIKSAQLDTALSKTQLLYWIATRKGFDESALTVNTNNIATRNETQTRGETNNNNLVSCSSFSSCSSLGLVGDCCPTPQGTFLECCL